MTLSRLTSSKTTYFKASCYINNFFFSFKPLTGIWLLVLLAKRTTNWFNYPNSEFEVFTVFSEKLAKCLLKERESLMTTSIQLALEIIPQWVGQCQESRNLRIQRNFKHHTRAFPSPSTASTSPIMNPSAPSPGGQLQLLGHFRTQPLPPPHTLSLRRACPWDFPLEPLGVNCIPLPIAAPRSYLTKIILCLLSILYSTQWSGSQHMENCYIKAKKHSIYPG